MTKLKSAPIKLFYLEAQLIKLSFTFTVKTCNCSLKLINHILNSLKTNETLVLLKMLWRV